jgi:hypothetical protein
MALLSLTGGMSSANINVLHLDDFHVYDDNSGNHFQTSESPTKPTYPGQREPLSDISLTYQSFYQKVVVNNIFMITVIFTPIFLLIRFWRLRRQNAAPSQSRMTMCA